jgi:hypothetical protein
METITLLIIFGLKTWSIIYSLMLLFIIIVRIWNKDFNFNIEYKESFIFTFYFMSLYAWTL